jgi:hypothetical protein
MSVFTRHGFYSIAYASKRDGSLDSQSVTVRVWCIAHLRSLQQRFPDCSPEYAMPMIRFNEANTILESDMIQECSHPALLGPHPSQSQACSSDHR